MKRKVTDSYRIRSGQGVCWMLYLECGHLIFKTRLSTTPIPEEIECEFCSKGEKRRKG